MTHNNRERGEFEILISVIIIAVLLIGAGIFAAAWNGSRQTMTCMVESKQATSKKDGGNKYLLFTENCGALEVADSFWNGKFNSTDTFAKIKEGQTYTFDTVGWRNGFFSAYPNVIEARQ